MSRITSACTVGLRLENERWELAIIKCNFDGKNQRIPEIGFRPGKAH